MIVRHEEFQDYLTDASNMPGGFAEKLIVPESEAEVAEALRDANRQKMPVTVSGARTGTVGGAIPFGGCVMSLERLSEIKSIDKETRRAVVEPGVVLADFQSAVKAEGLFYPPDPTEWSCQIGGTVATNASGARSFKYGATRRYVERIRVALADGDVLEFRRGENRVSGSGTVALRTPDDKIIVIRIPTYRRPDVTKNVSGYFAEPGMDVIDLFIGSEGTLGVVTEIELSLLPKPQGIFSGVVFFRSQTDLMDFVHESRTTSIATRAGHGDSNVFGPLDASLIEYFDDKALGFIAERFPETPSGMTGSIYFEQETTAENEDELFEGWNDLLERCKADLDRSWFTTTEQDREKMRAFRHALPVSVNERVVRNKQKKIGTDMAVPYVNFPGFLHYYKETLDASGIDYVIFGHIGDCHLHANLLPKDDVEAERARHLYGRFVAQAIMLGGTISAEHGIGKLKSKYLNVMMGERYLNEMADLKRAFDPNGILGRGNMFGLEFKV
jgi:D-lactate dehydrogenase (cytochrome)